MYGKINSDARVIIKMKYNSINYYKNNDNGDWESSMNLCISYNPL